MKQNSLQGLIGIYTNNGGKRETNNISANLIATDISLCGKIIRLAGPREWNDAGPRLSYWWQPTTAAVALATHLFSLNNLEGKRVLDLGCGLGLAGIAAGLLGAEVVFMDAEAAAVDFARYNAALNGLPSHRVDFLISDWEQGYCDGPFQLIVGSEILYDYFTHGALIRVIKSNLAENGSLMLADRKRLCVSRFLGRMYGQGFRCQESIALPHVESFAVRGVSLFELKPSKSLDEIT